LTAPISGMICHPGARTCCYQSAYQIWSLCLRPLRKIYIYRNTKFGKWSGLG